MWPKLQKLMGFRDYFGVAVELQGYVSFGVRACSPKPAALNPKPYTLNQLYVPPLALSVQIPNR